MVTIEAVWDRTTDFLSERLGDTLRIAVPFVFAPMAVMGVVMPLVGREPTVRNGVLGVLALVMAVGVVWGNLALTAFVLAPVERAGALRAATARLPAKILVSVVELLVGALLVVPIFVAFAISGVIPGQMAAGVAYPTIALGSASFILIYTLVMTILVAIVLARLLLVDPVLVAERRGVSALPRAFGLTRGLTLKLFGVLLLYVIVSQVATMATRTVFGTILGLLVGGDGPVTAATIVTAILVALVQTGFAVLAIVFAARLYIALRDTREGIVELA